ncbi:TetR/AcrR family transcriptional regulator [Nonomuraea sp. NPDC050547]|uniref:TetR/AcrR family transcriptional regulator n=1 Tax=Nonomuraea sp. NPDC050547 TaxID=3364368 RepID=UPI0037B7C195
MAASRDEIVAVAIHHLNHAPNASMAEIAQAAGISRATLHRHFSTRAELQYELSSRAMDAWAKTHAAVGLDEALRAGLDAAGIKQVLDELLTVTVAHSDEHGFALTDHTTDRHADLVRRAAELEEREIALFTAAQRAGVLRADLPPRWVSNLVYGLLVAVRESMRRGDVARRDLPRIFLETFYRGTT